MHFHNLFVNKSNQTKLREKSRSWAEEKYDMAVIQRNLLFLVLILFIALSVVLVFVLLYVSNNTTVKPFIIQLDSDSGFVRVLKESSQEIDQNESLAQFFIRQYLVARETYNPVDFTDIAINKVRVFSSNDVFNQFLGYIRSPGNNPTIKYGIKNSTYLTIKSWSKVSSDRYIVRFSVTETSGNMIQFHKISVVEFKYLTRSFSEQDLEINPVGFTITAYRVDADGS